MSRSVETQKTSVAKAIGFDNQSQKELRLTTDEIFESFYDIDDVNNPNNTLFAQVFKQRNVGHQGYFAKSPGPWSQTPGALGNGLLTFIIDPAAGATPGRFNLPQENSEVFNFSCLIHNVGLESFDVYFSGASSNFFTVAPNECAVVTYSSNQSTYYYNIIGGGGSIVA